NGAIRSTDSSLTSTATTSCPCSCSDSARLEPKLPRPITTNRFLSIEVSPGGWAVGREQRTEGREQKPECGCRGQRAGNCLSSSLFYHLLSAFCSPLSALRSLLSA